MSSIPSTNQLTLEVVLHSSTKLYVQYTSTNQLTLDVDLLSSAKLYV